MKMLTRLITDELPFFLACPALLWQVVFLYIPFFVLAIYSICDYSAVTGTYFLTGSYYSDIIHSLCFKIILRSFFVAILIAAICFIIAYPVAYYLAVKSGRRYKTLLLFTLILPSWTNLIVQTYAWFFLLGKNGMISVLLQRIGLISPSFHLLNNYFSIIVGMVSCYLPFMILPIYAVLEKMDKQYLEASADLGADRFETFRRIVFPLSLPGVYAGLLLVFIPSFGEFAIPSLLGGSKYAFWGSVIVDKFLKSRDWRSGAALAFIGVMFPIMVMGLTYVLLRGKKIVQRYRQSHHDGLNGNGSAKEFWG